MEGTGSTICCPRLPSYPSLAPPGPYVLFWPHSHPPGSTRVAKVALAIGPWCSSTVGMTVRGQGLLHQTLKVLVVPLRVHKAIYRYLQMDVAAKSHCMGP